MSYLRVARIFPLQLLELYAYPFLIHNDVLHFPCLDFLEVCLFYCFVLFFIRNIAWTHQCLFIYSSSIIWFLP